MGRLDTAAQPLTRFARRVREELRCPVRLVLFGSRGRGDQIEGSDYDLVAISDAFDGLGFADRALLLERLWDLADPAEFLCYTPGEYDRKRKELGIVSEVDREGIVVFDG